MKGLMKKFSKVLTLVLAVALVFNMTTVLGYAASPSITESIGKTTATFSWTFTDPQLDHFEILLRDEEGSNNILLIDWTDANGGNSHTFIGLNPDYDYEFKVRAVDASGTPIGTHAETDFTTLALEEFTITLDNATGTPMGLVTEFSGESYVYTANGPNGDEIPGSLDWEVTGSAVYSENGNELTLEAISSDVTISASYDLRVILDHTSPVSRIISGEAGLVPFIVDHTSGSTPLADFTDLLFSQDSKGNLEVDVQLDESIDGGSISYTRDTDATGHVTAVADTGYQLVGFRYLVYLNLDDNYDSNYDGGRKAYIKNPASQDYLEHVFGVNVTEDEETLFLEAMRYVDYDAYAHLEPEFIVYVTADFERIPNVTIDPIIYVYVDGNMTEDPTVGFIDLTSGYTDGSFVPDGELDVDDNTGAVVTAYLEEGTEIEFYAHPNSGYRFIGWKADIEVGDYYPDGKSNPRYREVASGNNTFGPAPVFERITVELNVIVDATGNIELPNDYVSFFETKDFSGDIHGNPVSFDAHYYSGGNPVGTEYLVDIEDVTGHYYIIYEWVEERETRVSEVSELGYWSYYGFWGDSIEGELNSEETYLIIYKPFTYNIEFLVHPDSTGLGSVQPVGVNTYSYGDNINSIATPASGYRFVKWWGEFEEYDDVVVDESNGPQLPRIAFREPNMVLKPITDITRANDNFNVDGSIQSTTGDTQVMYPLDLEQLYFVTRIYAEFELIPPGPGPTPTPTPTPTVYTLTVNVEGNGSVPGFEGVNSFTSGTNVNLSALSDDDALYEFVGWTGDVSDTSNDIVVVMNGNKTITAVFGEIGEDIIEEDEEIPEAAPSEEEALDEEILDEVTPLADGVALPQTSGVASTALYVLGIGLAGIGIVVKRRKY